MFGQYHHNQRYGRLSLSERNRRRDDTVPLVEIVRTRLYSGIALSGDCNWRWKYSSNDSSTLRHSGAAFFIGNFDLSQSPTRYSNTSPDRPLERTFNFNHTLAVRDSIYDTVDQFVHNVISGVMTRTYHDREIKEMYREKEYDSVLDDPSVTYEVTRCYVMMNEYERTIHFDVDLRVYINEP